MAEEQSPEVARGHPERVGELAHAGLAVEESALDQPERARDRRGRAPPRRSSRRGLRTAAKARSKPGALRRGRGRKEDDVPGLRGLDRARGPAIDPGRLHTRVEDAVEARIAR